MPNGFTVIDLGILVQGGEDTGEDPHQVQQVHHCQGDQGRRQQISQIPTLSVK